jgi:hypothetical protein
LTISKFPRIKLINNNLFFFVAHSLSANIRLTTAAAAAGTTMNNGTWLQTTSGVVSGAAGFTPIRAATITVGGRAVRPAADGSKMIQIQQQHVAQVQQEDFILI